MLTLSVAVVVATLATPMVVHILWRQIEGKELPGQFRASQ
jgi:hypothetical protein